MRRDPPKPPGLHPVIAYHFRCGYSQKTCYSYPMARSQRLGPDVICKDAGHSSWGYLTSLSLLWNMETIDRLNPGCSLRQSTRTEPVGSSTRCGNSWLVWTAAKGLLHPPPSCPCSMCEVAHHLASESEVAGCVLRCPRGIEVSMVKRCGPFTSGSEALGESWVPGFGKAQAEVAPVPSHGASALSVERRSQFFS